tara:strand:+ start:283 stop:591 length:309 start_codon:yes stop_codon:yes gene_type:complete
MTKQELAIYFGERRSVFANPKDLKIVGNWIFWRNPEWVEEYPDDIEVYRYPCGDIAECFTEIKKDKSPFNKNLDQKELDEILEDLDNNWHEFNNNEKGGSDE